MNYVLAIDVGTSFTAAAVARLDRNARPVPESLPLGLRGTAVPSVVYYPQEGPILVGEAAERRGLDSPERVVREFKRRVGDAVPICVGTMSLAAEDVFATMARWVADRAEEREGAPPSRIVMSHPASWGGHRTALILDALAAKGLADVDLITEPEAAALHYASQVRVEDGSTIGVYDLGGGTFDTAVLRKATAGRFEFLGRPEGIEGLGGADFDAAVFGHVAEHAGAALAGVDHDMPGALAALARLRRECVEAKEALSSDTEASISVFLPGIQQQVRLVRAEFEAMIEGPIRETVDALESSLQDVGLTAGDLSAVLLIGGSSRIPLVAQLISQQLDRPIAVDADPKSSICLGAAVSALGAEAPAAAELVAAAGVPVTDNASPHASWSRKPAGMPRVLSDGKADGPEQHHPGHRPHRGTQVQKPTVRVTTAAAAAALFTVLTATAAQSPEGLGQLSSIFVPPAADASKDSGAAPALSPAVGGGEDTSIGAGVPATGIEASGQQGTGNLPGATGIAMAIPTAGLQSWAGSGQAAGSTPQIGVAAAGNENSQTTDGSAAQTPDQAGTTADPAGSPTDSDPAPGTSTPTDPASEPGPEPSDPAPAPDPMSEPAPEPTPEPTPQPTPEPAPEPTPEPAPQPTPVPTPEPTPEPTPQPTPVPTPEPTIPEPTIDPTAEPSPTPEPSVDVPTTETSTAADAALPTEAAA
ncbi:molecular chaperone DnaK [Arthrobacter pascens]|uniref:Hsp70 family protein n=1 Tax=Arthrobacter pascens TaxID=1677 RepID=UPI002786883F|nr:Hsp70 family protein [Arthrobacter pascens]MDQ0632667.1 molecular chaperone DnaK [Arthrobacter pascens]